MFINGVVFCTELTTRDYYLLCFDGLDRSIFEISSENFMRISNFLSEFLIFCEVRIGHFVLTKSENFSLSDYITKRKNCT